MHNYYYITIKDVTKLQQSFFFNIDQLLKWILSLCGSYIILLLYYLIFLYIYA